MASWNFVIVVLWNGLSPHVWRKPSDIWIKMINAIKNIMTSSHGNIFLVSGHLCGEFTGPGDFPAQRPVTRSFDVFFDLRPNKRLSKQS